ncbi:MAG: hypothetical protein JSW17_06225 [Candidatus Omnitrophota bacterium]|nr:MAG: hypothetical protein JSW17_06225 [Candidatus Omnitrophota bacterium]
MQKRWLKELARDFVAFGSIPFLVLTIARVSVIKVYYPMQFIISTTIFLILRAFFKANLRGGIGFILLVFISLFYNHWLFNIFAIIVYSGLVASLFYLKEPKKEILMGVLLGVISSAAGYLIVKALFM